METTDLCFCTVAELSRLIHGKAISPLEVAAAALGQIDRLDPTLNAFITVLRDEALAAARKAEEELGRGRDRGPLHGIPIALKDLFCTRGIRTTAGSAILAAFIPAEDATVVARLRAAGAVIVGKTSLHEFAFGTVNTNPHFGDTRNPWDPSRITGGSSGGSAAAVAAGMCAAALGSDTGGSIRIPAALCGVFGLKPTWGRVSRHGLLPLAPSLDHVGLLARTAEDASIVLQAIAGQDPDDTTSSPHPVPDYRTDLARGASGLKIAMLREYCDCPMEPAVAVGFRDALEVLKTAGIRIEAVSLPGVQHTADTTGVILGAEAAAWHRRYYPARAGEYGADVRERIEAALGVTATDVDRARRDRTLLTERISGLFSRYDALVWPTEPITAPPLDQEFVELAGVKTARGRILPRWTRLANLTGLPAASVACGFDTQGLPFAFQVVGAPFAEGTVLRIAHAYQALTDWHRRRPPLAGASPG